MWNEMKEKEEQITAQIETVNGMLEVICDELNNLESIDDYEIELDSQCYRTMQNKRPYNKYKILVTVKKSLEKEVS